MTSNPLPPPPSPNHHRRQVLALGALAFLGLAGAATPATRRRRILFFSVQPADVPSMVAGQALLREALREYGFADGADYEIRYVWEQRIGNVAARMEEELRAAPDLVITLTTPVALAAARATSRVPVVFGTVSDPVASGLVQSLARPGGNVTGVANVLPTLSGKLIELIREILPGTKRIAVLWNPDNPAKALELREVQAHAGAAGIECVLRPTRSVGEIDEALSTSGGGRVAAALVLSDTLTNAHRDRIARNAIAIRLPTFFNYSPQVEAGGLASYSPDYQLQQRRLGELAGKILAGANPATLPVEQPVAFELMVNLKTARAIGVDIPRSILLRADRVIE